MRYFRATADTSEPCIVNQGELQDMLDTLGATLTFAYSEQGKRTWEARYARYWIGGEYDHVFYVTEI